MKQLYLISVLSILLNLCSYGQTDLIGTWYLDALTVNGDEYSNVYPQNIDLIFTETTTIGDFKRFDGSSSCNFIFGDYSATSNSIDFHSLGSSALDCSNEPRGEFETIYLDLLSDNYTFPSQYTYTIDGVGDEQSLTLTNSNNDTIIYRKTATTNILFGTWYLQMVVENGITYNNTTSDSPNIDITTASVNPFFGTYASLGDGNCNTFSADYGIYFGNGDEIKFSNFNPTTNSCDPPNDLEESYFSILGNDQLNKFSFELINDGNILILTSVSDGSGGRSNNSNVTSLTFSNQPLAIDSELLGTWYLDHIQKNGVTHPNYFNDNEIFDLEISSNPVGGTNTYEFVANHGCNTSTGSYSVNSNEINLSMATTLADCLTRPYAIYESLFYDEFNYNTGFPITHEYAITGTGNDEVLTLTNPNTSNTLVYKRQQPTTLLVTTWWLYQIDIPGNPVIDIPDTDAPFLTLTNTVDFLFDIEATGFGDCNSLDATYFVTFNGANNLNIKTFGQSLLGCSINSYELPYFQILGTQATNFFEFEIINNGETLILTDLLGARLIFGNVPLSIDDQSSAIKSISLKKNPVSETIELVFDDALLSKDIEYSVYSIDGKLMISSKLDKKTIEVRNFDTGIYIVSFSENQKPISSLKFIKK